MPVGGVATIKITVRHRYLLELYIFLIVVFWCAKRWMNLIIRNYITVCEPSVLLLTFLHINVKCTLTLII